MRRGDTLVVPELGRLARSVPDARAIGDSLVARGVKLSLGGRIYGRRCAGCWNGTVRGRACKQPGIIPGDVEHKRKNQGLPPRRRVPDRGWPGGEIPGPPGR